MPAFSTNREFLGYLLVLLSGMIDAFLIAHPSLIVRAGHFYPELYFLSRLSTALLLSIGILSFFYVVTGIITYNAAVKYRKIKPAFFKIKSFCAVAGLFLLSGFVLFNFTGYYLLDWPFRFGYYLFGLIILVISVLRLRSLYRIRRWHEMMRK